MKCQRKGKQQQMSAIGLLSHRRLDMGLLGKDANLLGGKPRMDLTEGEGAQISISDRLLTSPMLICYKCTLL